ncbi:MAG: hypothetical protein A4S09_16420 [Proteobacteria bacterium SG_bin7]|nr:MAG: hypothetical protein A4S09_16420 [Proteobacteria bacterium SG_bin7]
MKNVLMLFALLGCLQLKAESEFNKNEAYLEIQKLMNVQGDKQPALELAKALFKKLDEKDRLYPEIKNLIVYLGDGNPTFPLDKAIKFVTGKKEEVYCKDAGLVYLKGLHNDGTKSELKLVSNSRKMDGSYAIMKKGDWVYELDTEYRDPVKSDSWLEESTNTSFKLKEFRRLKNEKFDEGVWTSKWDGKSNSLSYQTNGDTPEPIPMFMANDYHLWGSPDLGYKIQFKVGATDKISSHEQGPPKTIYMKGVRTVEKKLDTFDYSEANGKKYSFKDCFLVVSKIELDHLEDPKPRQRK